MAWVYLLIAGVLEVVWAFTMKQSHGFTNLKYSAITIVAMIASFGLLSLILGRGVPVLGDARYATFGIIFAALWPQTAYCMILYLTGLTALNHDQVEAARMEGARGWSMLRYVILPQALRIAVAPTVGFSVQVVKGTAVTSIIGFTDLLLDTPLEPQQRRHLSTVRHSAHSLLGLLNDILDTAKLDKGAVQLEEEDFVVADVCHLVVGTLRIQAEKKGLHLLLDIQPQVPAYLRGDALRIQQVLTNLMGNAVKFTESQIVTTMKQVEAGGQAGQKIGRAHV